MGLEGGVSKLSDLNASWPLATDDKNQGDDHLRNIKAALASLIPDGLAVPYGLVQLGFPAVWAAGNLFQVDSDGISLKAVAPSALTGVNADKVDGQDAAEFAAASHTHSHTALTDKGVKTHAEIDTHVVSTANPHSVTANQVLPSQTGNSGKYLKTDGANPSWAALDASGGGLQRITVFTASGTWTKQAGVSKIKVTVVGGGGGGGVHSIQSGVWGMGAGGAGGGTAIKFIDVSAVTSVAVTVGGAGANGTAGVAGSAGGTSSFGAYCSATGGGGGPLGSTYQSATGGVGSGGDLNIRGCPGEMGQWAVSGNFTSGGNGGASTHGGGGSAGTTGGNGAGGAYGGGGAGEGNQAGYAACPGAAGVVIVEEYS